MNKVASCDPQEVNRKPDEWQEVGSSYVDNTDNIITQDLDKNDPPGAIVSLFETPFHDTGQLLEPNSVQDKEFDNKLQHEIKHTESLLPSSSSDINVQTDTLGNVSLCDTIEPNKTVLNTSMQEAQVLSNVSDMCDINVEDNLSEDTLSANDDAQINTRLLSVPQEEQTGCTNQPDINVGNVEPPLTEEALSPVMELCKKQPLSPKPSLLPKDDAQTNPKVLSVSQEGQAGNIDHTTETVDPSLTEEILSPVVELYKQEPLSPKTSPLLKKPVSPQASPSPQQSPIVDIMSLSPRDNDDAIPVCRTVPRIQLVDYGYDADSDSMDEDDVIDGDAPACATSIQIKPAAIGQKFIDDSTDSISDDSDSNYLVRGSCGRKVTATAVKMDSNSLTHSLSDTGTGTATGSCDEKMEVQCDLKVPALESTALLSPPCMKPVEQNSPISPVLSNDNTSIVPLIMDDGVSAGLVEDQADLHAMDTPLCVSTVSAVTTPSIATTGTISVLQVHVPHLSTSATSPVFDLSNESVYPVSNTPNLTVVVSSAGSSTSHSLSVKSNSSLSPVTTFKSIPSFCKNTFEGGTVSNAEFFNMPANSVICFENDDIELPINFSTGFVISPSLKTPPYSTLLPVSIACSEVSVFASPTSIPKTCPSPVPVSIPASDTMASTSTPILTSQACSSSVNDNISVTMVTQTSMKEETHLLDTDTTTNTSTVTCDKNDDDEYLNSAQTLGDCQVDKEDSAPGSDNDKNNDDDKNVDDDIPISTFPAALKLSIDLAVLPQKKRVIQKAKWAALLTTPVPVLRERKKAEKTTVTVQSTIIKSDRKPTAKSIPKKQLQLSPVNSQYKVGDNLWSKFSYWDLWPCKIILHSDVDQPEPTPDQVKLMSAFIKA